MNSLEEFVMGKKKDKRFEVVHNESTKALTSTMILKDKQTGVHYLYVAAGYGGGLTTLLDKNGKPIIDINDL